MERAVEPGTTSGCSRSPDAGPARDYLRSRGYDGEVVRQFRLGWAPDDWDALAKALKLPEKVLVGLGPRLRQPPRPGAGLLPGPRALPDLRPFGTPGRAGRAHPAAAARAGAAGAARAQVQELAGVADLLQAADALRAQLGQARGHRPGRGRGVRGLHRRHRLLPGRRAVGRRDLRHRTGRGALHAAAQLRQAHRAGLRRRRGGAERDVARLRVGAQARGRRRGGGPARRQRPRRSGPHRPGGAGPAIKEARPFLQFRVDRMLGAGDLDHGRGPGAGGRRGPHGGCRAPRRPGPRPVRDAAGRPVPPRRREAARAPRPPAGASARREQRPARPHPP